MSAGTIYTKVKSLDNNRDGKNFIVLSCAVISLFLAVLVILSCIYLYSSIDAYKYILFILILVTIIVGLLFIIALIAVNTAYWKKHINSAFLWVAKAGLKMILPLITFLEGFFRNSKDSVRRFYVEVNNILVESVRKNYKPEQVLVLLPHCLQDSECEHRITNSIHNCRRCGKCRIAEISKIVKDKGVEARIVTGGTAARNIVRQVKPKVILSVACERDLVSGIADVGNIPVIGITNERPNGPCNNTTLDIAIFRERLEEIL
jgi:hypothetical protein